MQIFVIANTVPMQDRSAGWLRFFNILQILAQSHKIILHPVELQWQIDKFGCELVSKHKHALEAMGIEITDGKLISALSIIRSRTIDIHLIEQYEMLFPQLVEELRYCRPTARIIVDTIDVAFNRLSSKARITKNPEDMRLAERVKDAELSAYRLADVVIAVSDVDAKILTQENPNLHIEIVPLLFQIHPLSTDVSQSQRRNILYVADFGHDANIDGILNFCEETFPLIVKELPDVRLRVVGASPPPSVLELAGPNIQILGFVQNLDAIYASSDVAIAPMRFGSGLKGKIAEAMSHGVPVVTNSANLQGFGVTPGQEILSGDDPISFAKEVIKLLRDPALYSLVRQAGWNFVDASYSRPVVEGMLTNLMSRVDSLPLQSLTPSKRLARSARTMLDKHILWRFNR